MAKRPVILFHFCFHSSNLLYQVYTPQMRSLQHFGGHVGNSFFNTPTVSIYADRLNLVLLNMSYICVAIKDSR